MPTDLKGEGEKVVKGEETLRQPRQSYEIWAKKRSAESYKNMMPQVINNIFRQTVL